MQSIRDKISGYEKEIEQLRAENTKLKSQLASRPAAATKPAEPQGRAMIEKLNSLTGAEKVKYYRANKVAIDALYKVGI